MKVKDLMTSPVQYCGPDTNLAEAAKMMWDSDCGILPVVDRGGKVISMITDRDICMAAATRGRLASDILVWEASSSRLHACSPNDDIRSALSTMQRGQVRRLPVVDEDGMLCGVLTMNDLVLNVEDAAGNKKMTDLSYTEVIKALKAISSHRILAAA